MEKYDSINTAQFYYHALIVKYDSINTAQFYYHALIVFQKDVFCKSICHDQK